MKVSASNQTNHFRFSGHETFACRYAWLPKAAHAVKAHNDILTASREDDAMVELGVGKNMVHSIRFWAEATDIIVPAESGHEVTEFGEDLFLRDGAFDSYMEDIQTLWLLHWKLSTNRKCLIFAWDYLLNQFHESALTASVVVRAFVKAAAVSSDKKVTEGSLRQLYDVFIHSYVPTRGKKGEVREDNLDCPFVELELLHSEWSAEGQQRDERGGGKYSFRRAEKSEIGASLFAFCLAEFWDNRHSSEQSIPLHAVLVGHGSPGQVFKIPEADIRSRLLGIEEVTNGYFVFQESAMIPRLVRDETRPRPQLAAVYCVERAHE